MGEYAMDMKRVSEMAQRVHPALVEQLFSESTLAEIARWEEIEERLRIEESEDDFAPAREGCVYFSDTPSMHGSIMKIGGTKYDGTTRAKQLFQAGVLEPYTCRLEKRFDDWKLCERAIQEYFKSSRVYSNKEFFFVTQEQAQTLFDQLDGTVPLQAEDQSKWEQALSTTKAKIEKYRHMWHLKQLKGRDSAEPHQARQVTSTMEDRVCQYSFSRCSITVTFFAQQDSGVRNFIITAWPKVPGYRLDIDIFRNRLNIQAVEMTHAMDPDGMSVTILKTTPARYRKDELLRKLMGDDAFKLRNSNKKKYTLAYNRWGGEISGSKDIEVLVRSGATKDQFMHMEQLINRAEQGLEHSWKYLGKTYPEGQEASKIPCKRPFDAAIEDDNIEAQSSKITMRLDSNKEWIDYLKTLYKSKDEEITELRKSKDHATTQLHKEKNIEIAELRAEIAGLRKSKDDAIAELRKEKSAKFAEFRKEKEAEISELRKEIRVLTSQVAAQTQEIGSLTNKITKTEGNLQSADDTIKCLREMINKPVPLEDDPHWLKSKIGELKLDLEIAIEQRDEFEKELEKRSRS